MTQEHDNAKKPGPTPGPWRVERCEDELVRFSARHLIGGKPNIAIWADGEFAQSGFFHEIALVAEDDIANARLIAAAPALLAALEALTDWGRDHTSPLDVNSPHQLLVDARAAIAKAKGV